MYHEDAVEFIETFDDPYYFWEAPDSLMKQLANLGISTEIKPNRFDDNLAQIAEDPEYREDVMNGIFGAAGFVTTDTMDGLQIMYEDKDGIRHKLKDENNKDVIVPLNRLKEIKQPESYMM
ncbi:MAG: hypothetical protein GWO07_05215, partial [Candidatus Dadabacteria bacterium]|nr:hypothetical protein [Candidatus Dadabacteria bacterium]NIU88502.1 hypothetical protein [Nitrosopumilaceae archaeon]NIX15115.1 hypothetical protein [Candidatus Dadabacteria bacterium]